MTFEAFELNAKDGHVCSLVFRFKGERSAVLLLSIIIVQIFETTWKMYFIRKYTTPSSEYL